MFSLETMGYYADRRGTQNIRCRSPIYPDIGNFIGLVSNLSCTAAAESARAFRRHAVPVRGRAAPASSPASDWSDHWSFWQEGYRALMVTDTALFRYPVPHRRRHARQDLLRTICRRGEWPGARCRDARWSPQQFMTPS